MLILIHANKDCLNAKMSYKQGPDLYAFIAFGAINDMYLTLSGNMCYILIIKY